MKNWVFLGQKLWWDEEFVVNLQRKQANWTMAKGYSWKTRNRTNINRGLPARKILERELKSEPQYTLEDLFISPFRQKRRYDEEGRWRYVPIERRTAPTGIRVMDDFLNYLAEGQSDMQAFADRHGLKTEEVAALVFILTGMKGVRFRQLYQIRLVDELLRYTDLPFDEVARRSGLGSPNNMYLALRREYNMSASERRLFLRKEGDAGRYKL